MATLREEQKQVARDRIVMALAEEIVANGLADLSVPAVATRAGVSLRTVYNYFENREALLDGLSVLGDKRITEEGGTIIETDVDRMGDAIRSNFALFSDMDETLMDALMHVQQAKRRGTEPGTQADDLTTRRTQAVRAMVDKERPDLAEAERLAIGAFLRSIVSANLWSEMTRLGVSGEQAGIVSAWAFDTLVSSLRDHTTPFE